MAPHLSEAALHRAVAAYLHAALKPPAFFTTFPSGGGGKVRGAQLKAMGLLPGMPDLLVLWLSGSGLALLGLELKAKVGRLSQAQVECADKFADVGAHYRVCRSIEEVDYSLRQFRVPTRIVRMAA